jgi:hypothetical protein
MCCALLNDTVCRRSGVSQVLLERGGWTHVIAEHLINVGVHGGARVLLLWHEIVPVGQRLESIVDDDKGVAL